MILTPQAATLADLETIWRSECAVSLDPSSAAAIAASHALVARAARAKEPVYGVNTGFGKLASIKIAEEDTEALQRNLVLSHCCGVGAALDQATVRLMMVLNSAAGL